MSIFNVINLKYLILIKICWLSFFIIKFRIINKIVDFSKQYLATACNDPKNLNEFLFRAVYCRGSLYPVVLPRPSIGILTFKLSLCEAKTEKSQMEVSFRLIFVYIILIFTIIMFKIITFLYYCSLFVTHSDILLLFYTNCNSLSTLSSQLS